VVYNLVEPPFEMSCGVLVHEKSSSLSYEIGLFNPLDHSHVSHMCSQLSFSPKCYFNVPNDNSMLCDSNVDLGYQDNTFNMLNGKVANFLFLGYFGGYSASLDPYCIYLLDKPRTIIWNTFFDFSMAFALVKSFFGCAYLSVLLLSCL